MGAMREAMLREMALRGFAARTQRAYVGWMARLVAQTRVAADQLREAQVRSYLAESLADGLVALDAESGDQRGAFLLQRSPASRVAAGAALSAGATAGAGDADS